MKRNRSLLTLSIVLMISGIAVGQQVATNDASSAAEPASDEDKVVLRDPFWPLDYTPKGEVAPQPQPVPGTNTSAVAPVAAAPVVKWPVLKLKGLIKKADGKYVAQIDGVGIVESGRIVRKTVDGTTYSWKIGDITEKGVEITPLEARSGR